MSETIVVTGARDWTNRRRVTLVLTGLRDGGVERLVHGACPTGLDPMAGEIGLTLGLEVEPVPAEWGTYGRRAGPIRNRYMLDIFKPRLVVAFHEDLTVSRGTIDCVRAALDRDLPVLWWTSSAVVTVERGMLR